jgi:hypothetical protein
MIMGWECRLVAIADGSTGERTSATTFSTYSIHLFGKVPAFLLTAVFFFRYTPVISTHQALQL